MISINSLPNTAGVKPATKDALINKRLLQRTLDQKEMSIMYESLLSIALVMLVIVLSYLIFKPSKNKMEVEKKKESIFRDIDGPEMTEFDDIKAVAILCQDFVDIVQLLLACTDEDIILRESFINDIKVTYTKILLSRVTIFKDPGNEVLRTQLICDKIATEIDNLKSIMNDDTVFIER
jgi:hypothetical protein